MAAFVTTRWSLVAQVGLGEAEAREAALELLCRSYWRPVFEFALNSGFDRESAQDVTQAFFAKVLEKNALAKTDRELGRFRTFLLTMLKRFMSDWRDHGRREKRGGGQVHFSLDSDEAPPLVAPGESPELAYDRQWAITLMERATVALREEARMAGREDLFLALAPYLGADPAATHYEGVARDFGLSRNAVAMANLRLRTRFRELVRREAAETLSDAADVEAELAALREVLRGAPPGQAWPRGNEFPDSANSE